MQRTVLVIDDVETCSDTLELILGALDDIDIVTASSAEQAWETFENGARSIAAVVTDLEMRGMDGFELIERIRSHHRLAGVPIMVISGSSDPDARLRAERLGANAFFTKPYSAGLVRKTMEKLLAHETPMP